MSTSTWWTVALAVRAAWVAVDPARYRLAQDSTSDAPCTLYAATGVGLDEDTAGDFVVVAWPGEPDRERSPGGADQTFAPLAASAGRPRDERGRVEVRVVAQDGDDDPESTTARAMTYLGDLETFLRADPTVGISARRMVVEVSRFEVLPSLNRGSVVAIDVTLAYSARI